MPDQALFRIALHHAVDDLIGGEILLVTADDLDAPVLFVRGEKGEVLQDVEHHFGPEHAGDRCLHVVKLAFFLVFLVAPWAPHVDGHADGAVAEQTALGGEGENVRHEHGRHLFFVDLVHLKGPVEPGHRTARGRLGLADDHRQAVDEKDQVEPLLHRAGLIGPLVADRQPVVGGLGSIHQPHGHMLAVGAEGHGLFVPQPGHKVLVGPHQSVGLHREKAGTQVVNDLIGPVGLGGDFRIEPDERLPQPGLHHNVIPLARELGRGQVFPTGRTQLAAEGIPQPGESSRAFNGSPPRFGAMLSRIICSTVLASVKVIRPPPNARPCPGRCAGFVPAPSVFRSAS